MGIEALSPPESALAMSPSSDRSTAAPLSRLAFNSSEASSSSGTAPGQRVNPALRLLSPSSSTSHDSPGPSSSYTRSPLSANDDDAPAHPSEFRFPVDRASQSTEHELDSPSSSRLIHNGHNSLTFTAPSPISKSLATNSTLPRKINSRGMRLGAQLRNPESSNGHAPELPPPQAPALRDSFATTRTSTQGSISTLASTAESGSGLLDEFMEEQAGVIGPAGGSFASFRGRGGSFMAAAAAAFSGSSSNSNATSPARDSKPLEPGASQQRNNFAQQQQAPASSSKLGAAPPPTSSSSTAGPTPPRPPRKLGGRVAALAAKLSGNDLASSAKSPPAPALPSPSFMPSASRSSRAQSSPATSTSLDMGGPQGGDLSTDSVLAGLPSLGLVQALDGGLATSSSTASSSALPSPSHAPGQFSPRTSSLRRHGQQSSFGSARLLDGAGLDAQAGASGTEAAPSSSVTRLRSNSSRGSADLSTGSGGGPSSAAAAAAALSASARDGSGKGRGGSISAGSRVADGGLQDATQSHSGTAAGKAADIESQATGRQSGFSTGLKKALTLNLAAASNRAPASPPPRSPRRRMESSNSRMTDASGSPSPSPVPARDSSVGSGSIPRGALPSAFLETSASASTRTSAQASGSSDAVLSTEPGPPESQGVPTIRARTGAFSSAPGDDSTSTLADSSLIAMDGSVLETGSRSGNTSLRPSDLTVDTSLQSLQTSEPTGDRQGSAGSGPTSGSGSAGSGLASRSGSASAASSGESGPREKLRQSVDVGGPAYSAVPLSVATSSAWSAGASTTSSPFGAASPILGSASTPTATSASGHSTSTTHGQQQQPHNKALGRLSRLTYARNDGFTMSGSGAPHGGGKGWSDWGSNTSGSAGLRSPSIVGSSNGFSTSFGAAAGANTSGASSSGTGSVSMSSGMNSLRGSVDVNGGAAGTPLGLAIANASMAGGAGAGTAVSGAHGLTLGLSTDPSTVAAAGGAGFSHGGGGGGVGYGQMSSPAPYGALNAALMSARNSLPVGSLRADAIASREKDSSDRPHLAAVQEGMSTSDDYESDLQGIQGRAGVTNQDGTMGLGIDHSNSRPAGRSPSGPRASLPTLSGIPPQRELLLPALQNVRSTFEGHDHRRDTFSLGSGSASAPRPLSALVDDNSPLGVAVSNIGKDDGQQQLVSAVPSLASAGTRSTASSGTWSRTWDGPRHGSSSVSPPSTGESLSLPSGRASLQESAAGDRMRLNRKPSHPTLVEEAEHTSPQAEAKSQLGKVIQSDASRTQGRGSVGADTLMGQRRRSSDATMNTVRSDASQEVAPPGSEDVYGDSLTRMRSRRPPGPEDEIEGLTISLLPDGGFTYLDAQGRHLSSKTVLTLAIEKAQIAVTLDSSNQVPQAIQAYKHALRLLEEVMDRIAPKPGQKLKPSRDEERKRLVIIHVTYTDRIRLLSAIKGTTSPNMHMAKASLSQQSQRTNSDVQSTFNADMIPQRRKIVSGQDHPQRSDGFHEAIAAAHSQSGPGQGTRDRKVSLRNAASADLLSTRKSAATTPERPVSMAVQLKTPPSSQRFSTYDDELGRTEVDGRSLERMMLGDDAKRDSVATALTSHTLTPRNVFVGQLSADSKLHMPKISIQPESPESRQARLADDVPASDMISRAQRSPKVKGSQSDDQQYTHSDSEGSGHAGSSFHSRRRPSVGALSQARTATEGARTPTTPYFDTSSQLHLDDETSSKPSSRRASEWSAAGSDTVPEKDRSNMLGVGLMSPPQLLGEGENGRLRPISTYTDSGASQAASDGHLHGGEGDLDRALAGLDASLNQLSSERKQGTVRPGITRGQSRVSTNSNASGTERSAAAAANAVGATVRKQKTSTSSTIARPDMPDRLDSSRAPSEFPKMGGVAADADGEPEMRGVGSTGRQRSSSQPAPKRPPIPFSFMNGEPQPPVPRVTRKNSTSSTHILSPTSAAPAGRIGSGSNGNIRPGPGGQSGFRFPSPSPSNASAYGGPLSPSIPYYDEHGQVRQSGALDLFASGLPSMQCSGIPSFAAPALNTAIPMVDIDLGAYDQSQLFLMPSNVILRPFHVFRQLQSSLQQGSHLSRKLYAPKALWAAAQQPGTKIALLDLKVRMLDLVATGMEPVEAGGRALLAPPTTSQPGLLAVQATKFSRQMDEFEMLLLDVQNTLAQKMSIIEPVAGKKNKSAFGSISSRLKGSFGGLTSSNKGQLDTPAEYLFSISRLCAKVSHLEQHAQSILRAQSGLSENDIRAPGTETYAALPTEVRVSIEAKLKRTSDWLANVLLCFILRDVTILADRYTKRALTTFVEG